MSHKRRFTTVAVALACSLAFPVGAATALPVVPDDLPVFPQVTEQPQITVTFEDGTPVDGRTVHRGDVLLVHGTGFDPGANRGGFVLPVPPGTPNGVYVLYSALPEHWEPSKGVPGEARDHPHDKMAWVITDEALAAIPTAPVNMHRSIARVAQPMQDDGTFTARIVVDPPAETPGDRWGVYVYPGAGSTNSAEEFFVPLPFSPEPGANTPAPVSADLIFDAATIVDVAEAAGGGVRGRNGAQVGGSQIGDSQVAFTRDEDRGDGIVRYRGTAIATARFNTVDVAFADPWLERRGDGVVLTALVSTGPDVGVDHMQRRDIVRLGDAATGRHETPIGPIEIRR